MLVGAVPGFTDGAFAAEARGAYTRLLAAASGGGDGALRPLLTPAALAAVRAGLAGGGGAGAPRHGARVHAWDDAATRVVSVGVFGGKLGGVASAGDVEFAQVTLRCATVQEVWVVEEGGGAGVGAGGAGAAASAPFPALALWEAVADEETGCVYYWDRLSGRTTWEAPLPRAFVAASSSGPFRVEQAGHEREDAGKLGAKQLVRVVHDVTWEKCVKAGTNSAWAICRL